jgi:hypothetical protein
MISKPDTHEDSTMIEPSESYLQKNWKIVLGYVLIALAIGVFFWGNHAITAYKARSMAGQGWPTVEGRIIESKVEERVHDDDDGNRSYYYEAVITYEYFVNGSRYTSSRLGWEDYLVRDSRAEAQQFADSYPTGKVVIVHYDPEKPEFSLLDTSLPQRPNEAGIGYFIGCGVILAIALALIYGHVGLLYRIPGWTIIVTSMIVFMGGGVLTAMLNVRFAVLIGLGFVSFAIGGFVRGRQ